MKARLIFICQISTIFRNRHSKKFLAYLNRRLVIFCLQKQNISVNFQLISLSYKPNTYTKKPGIDLKYGFLKKSFIINPPLWVEHLNHHFLLGLLCCTHQKVMRRCSTHKGAFIINDFLRIPHFSWSNNSRIKTNFLWWVDICIIGGITVVSPYAVQGEGGWFCTVMHTTSSPKILACFKHHKSLLHLLNNQTVKRWRITLYVFPIHTY